MKLMALTALAFAMVACGARPGDPWHETSSTSPMDGTVRKSIATVSSGAPGSGADYAAELVVRCVGQTLDMYILTDDVLKPVGDGVVGVEVRVDSAPAVLHWWDRAENGRGAFSDSARALLASVRHAHRLLVGVWPYSGGQQVASFSLDGLSDHLAALPCVKP